MKFRFFLYLVAVGLIMFLMVFTSTLQQSRAQLDPTQQAITQTVGAIINPRLTLTATFGVANTATAIEQISETAVVNQTATVVALTETPIPTMTLTPSDTNVFSTNIPLDPTDQFLTLVGRVNELFTATANAGTAIAATQTFNAMILGTLGITATPDLMPNATAIPPANSPNPTQMQNTLAAAVQQSFTQTAQVQIGATATAQVQSTVAAIVNQNLTATGVALRSTLTYGFVPLKISNITQIKKLLTLKGHTASVSTLDFSVDGTKLVGASDDASLIVWDVVSGKLLTKSLTFSKRYEVAFNPDGIHIASGNSDGTLRIWDSQANTEQIITKGTDTTLITSVAFSPNGTTLAAGNTDGLVRTWDAQSGKLGLTLHGHAGAVTSVKFSPDGLRLATSGTDGSIRLWETTMGTQIGLFMGFRITKIAFSPDSSLIASANFDGTITLWDTKTRAVKATLRGHTDAVYSLSFSVDGTLIASASADGTVRIWDVKKGVSLVTLPATKGSVNDVEFSPDGVRLASAGQDGTVSIWAISGN